MRLLPLPGAASSGRAACAVRRPTQNTATAPDRGCLVSATHTCVLSKKARRSEIAPKTRVKARQRLLPSSKYARPYARVDTRQSKGTSTERRRKPARMSLFQNPVIAESAVLSDPACVAMTLAATLAEVHGLPRASVLLTAAAHELR